MRRGGARGLAGPSERRRRHCRRRRHVERARCGLGPAGGLGPGGGGGRPGPPPLVAIAEGAPRRLTGCPLPSPGNFDGGYGPAGGYAQSPGGFSSPTGTQAEKKQVGGRRGGRWPERWAAAGGRCPESLTAPPSPRSAPARRTSCPAPCRSCWRPSRWRRPSGSGTWRSRRWASGVALEETGEARRGGCE